MRYWATIWIFGLCLVTSAADEIRVAVASNFADTIREISGAYEEETGHRVLLSFGSTGKHYAQIRNGAPFDVFFAADVRRPELLEEEGVALPGTRFTYAIGRVVLWSPVSDLVDPAGKVLADGDFRYLSIANPRLAPYGKAAEQIMKEQGVWGTLEGRMVRGENIAQTYQFVRSGNAELGFVALSQIKSPGASAEGSSWLPPQSLYDPIEQQAVLLREDAVARDFLDFTRNSERARKIIRSYGYELGDAD